MFAKTPIAIVSRPAISAVALATATVSNPSGWAMIAGFKKMM